MDLHLKRKRKEAALKEKRQRNAFLVSERIPVTEEPPEIVKLGHYEGQYWLYVDIENGKWHIERECYERWLKFLIERENKVSQENS